ncbi:MAG: M20 family metallopeptidase [Bacteroidia bacterium]
MRQLLLSVLLVFSTSIFYAQPTQTKLPKPSQKGIENLDANFSQYAGIAHQIWEWAEVGYQETQSAGLLMKTLKDNGFSIEEGVAGMPTAFVASYGSGKPVIGILAEYDALPGVSQEATPEQKTRIEGGAGHACGHHLFGTASSGAAIEVKNWLDRTGKSGTIRLYGTPAEEGGAGKVYMVREGLFDDVDAVLHWHPSSSNGASPHSSLANKSAKFRFKGIPAHAAGAPHKGRSALDGVEAMNNMVNLMREHVPMETRIHYVITKGGDAPNVVPGFAEVYYYVRHPEAAEVEKIFARVVKAAEGAAIGTETTMEYEIIHGVYNLVPNEALAEVMYKNLSIVGGVQYDDKEKAFANKLRESFETNTLVDDAAKVMPYKVEKTSGGGSTDVGDISWVVPTTGLGAATWVPGTFAHSWQAVAAGGISIGHKGMMVAAKTIFLTAVDLFDDPQVIAKAKIELDGKRGKDFVYKPLLGDRKPPLDYRR